MLTHNKTEVNYRVDARKYYFLHSTNVFSYDQLTGVNKPPRSKSFGDSGDAGESRVSAKS